MPESHFEVARMTHGEAGRRDGLEGRGLREGRRRGRLPVQLQHVPHAPGQEHPHPDESLRIERRRRNGAARSARFRVVASTRALASVPVRCRSGETSDEGDHVPDLVFRPAVVRLRTEGRHGAAFATPHQDLVEELAVAAAAFM